MKTKKQIVGSRGEEEACNWLVGQGHRILRRNWRASHLELDIITIRERTIHIVEVKTRSGKPKKGYSWCGGVCRWMTTLKIDAINRFYRQFGSEVIVEYVGMASDERERIQFDRSDRTIKVYPLIMLGMTENDCLVKCYKSGFTWTEANGIDLYDVLDRVSCYCCGNKNMKELRAIYRYLPEYWQKLKDMQARTKKKFKRDQSIGQLELKFEKEEIEREII